MAEDHYVAQTYLKHFAGDSGKLRAYRRSNGKTFPCPPKDICAELDGDTIPEFLVDEKLLGKYRKIFEGAWNPAVEALQKRGVDQETKLHIAGYWQTFSSAPRRGNGPVSISTIRTSSSTFVHEPPLPGRTDSQN